MALDQSALLELAEVVQRADGGDLMRTLLETMLQSLVDAQATAHIGAGLHERTDTRNPAVPVAGRAAAPSAKPLTGRWSSRSAHRPVREPRA